MNDRAARSCGRRCILVLWGFVVMAFLMFSCEGNRRSDSRSIICSSIEHGEGKLSLTYSGNWPLEKSRFFNINDMMLQGADGNTVLLCSYSVKIISGSLGTQRGWKWNLTFQEPAGDKAIFTARLRLENNAEWHIKSLFVRKSRSDRAAQEAQDTSKPGYVWSIVPEQSSIEWKKGLGPQY